MAEFIPGMQLSEHYYWEAVRPILDQHFPDLQHSAGLLGWGSDALGMDTPVSRDHFWGPRLILFFRENEFDKVQPQVDRILQQNLPHEFHGYSTHFGEPDMADGGVRTSVAANDGPVAHLVEMTTIKRYWQRELLCDPYRQPDSLDWLTFSEHRLRALTGGSIFHDMLDLAAVRQRFAYYPQAVWLYLLASQWALISQEEAFPGRAYQVGDALGASLIAARLVEHCIHLCFLMEKQYAPYSKWLGSAFSKLPCAVKIKPYMESILATHTFEEMDVSFAVLYSALVEIHNELQITPPLDSIPRTYSAWHLLREGVTELTDDDPRNTRPFRVAFGKRISDALLAQIQDKTLTKIARLFGSVNQFLVESGDALQDVGFCRSTKKILINSKRKS